MASIAEALGLNEEWALINRHRVGKSLDNHETISDTMLECISELREEEFGEPRDISDYEKKIMMAGFHLAQEIIQKKQDAVSGALEELIKKFR